MVLLSQRWISSKRELHKTHTQGMKVGFPFTHEYTFLENQKKTPRIKSNFYHVRCVCVQQWSVRLTDHGFSHNEQKSLQDCTGTQKQTHTHTHTHTAPLYTRSKTQPKTQHALQHGECTESTKKNTDFMQWPDTLEWFKVTNYYFQYCHW